MQLFKTFYTANESMLMAGNTTIWVNFMSREEMMLMGT
jgi:hypothetical protein